MSKLIKILILFQVFNIKAAQALSHKAKDEHNPKFAKNSILFIGDGMGGAQITASRIWSQGSKGSLSMENISNIALIKTYSLDNYTTDSAAAGTALACGQKTYNGYIGMTRDENQRPEVLSSLIQKIKAQGKSIGIISTTRVSHATPAAFFAHVENRNMEEEIVSQIESSDVDLLMGGGKQFFYPENYYDTVDHKQGLRKDQRNVVSELEDKNWKFLSHRQELSKQINIKTSQKVLGLFNMSHISYTDDRKNHEPSLEEMVTFAISYLSKNPKGYFLMVEGGRIDHASHDNYAKKMLKETIDFDKSIAYALRVCDLNETLIAITADHETGGLAINGYGSVDHMRGEKLLGKSEKDPQTDISHWHLSWSTGPNYSKVEDIEHPSGQYSKDAAHTAIDVPLLTTGKGTNLFRGFLKNSDIPHLILEAMGTTF